MRHLIQSGIVVMLLVASASIARADDWTAVRLRGVVLQLVDGEWLKLSRNDVVPDSRVVRTMGAGYVAFVRGKETIELSPNTEIQIFDEPSAKPFTTVRQYFGTVSIEAEVQNVQHFAVDTPYLAAVVKGTRFVVTSGDSGASVEVNRGHVEVHDKQDRTLVTISVGQSATVNPDSEDAMTVAGEGELPEVVEDTNPPASNASSNASEGKANSTQGGSNSNGNGNSGNSGGNSNGKGNGNSGGNSKDDEEGNG